MQTKGPEDKKVDDDNDDDDAQGFTSERLHRFEISRKAEGRGLASIEGCLDTSAREFNLYLKENKGKTNYSRQ